MGAYLQTKEQANEFTEEAVKLKLSQIVDTREVDAASQMGVREDHPVIPSRKEISRMAIEAASRVLHPQHGEQQLALALDARNEETKLLENPKVSRPDIGEMESLERVKRRTGSGDNFVISKARNIDNLPEKAQAN